MEPLVTEKDNRYRAPTCRSRGQEGVCLYCLSVYLFSLLTNSICTGQRVRG